jgi:hypothetical protein
MKAMMSLLAVLTFLVAGAVLIASVVAARASRLQTVYRRLATQYGGASTSAGALDTPTARFAQRDAAVQVSVVRPSGFLGPRATQVVVRQRSPVDVVQERLGEFSRIDAAAQKPRPPFSCTITPAGFLQRTAYLVGRRKGISSSPDFNLRYVVETDDRRRAAQLLTRYVEMQINRLRQFQGVDDVYVRFEGDSLTVERRGVIRNERSLRQFVAYCLELNEQAAAAFGVGIDVLSQSADNHAHAVCKICGDGLGDEEIVYCRVCDTPHHRDCWRYFGGCSVYACGERRYARAPRQRSAP